MLTSQDLVEYQKTVFSPTTAYQGDGCLKGSELVDGFISLIYENYIYRGLDLDSIVNKVVKHAFKIEEGLIDEPIRKFWNGIELDRIVQPSKNILDVIIKAEPSKLFEGIEYASTRRLKDKYENLEIDELLTGISKGKLLMKRVGDYIFIVDRNGYDERSNCTVFELLTSPYFKDFREYYDNDVIGALALHYGMFNSLLLSGIVPSSSIESYCYLFRALINVYELPIPRVHFRKHEVSIPVNEPLFDFSNSTIINLISASLKVKGSYQLFALPSVIEKVYGEGSDVLSSTIDSNKFVDDVISKFYKVPYSPTYIIDTEGKHIYTNGGSTISMFDEITDDYVEFIAGVPHIRDEKITKNVSLISDYQFYEGTLKVATSKKVYTDSTVQTLMQCLLALTK